MLKALGAGLITSTILLSTNGIIDASTNSLYTKNKIVTNNAQITTAVSKDDEYWRIGQSRTVEGVSAEPLVGWPDVIDIKVNRNGTITMTTVGKGYAEVKVTRSNGKKVYYVFEVK